MNKFVTVLSFSGRNHGNCQKISDYISNFHLRTNVYQYSVDSEVFAPCGRCDYECLRAGAVCPNLSDQQTQIMDRICSSDLVYFIVPNYCGGPSGNYFAFNERSVGYFGTDREKKKQYMSIPKKFIVISNTEGFERYLKQQTNKEPNCLYLKTGKYGKQSTAGDLLDSAEACRDLVQFLAR